MIRNIANIVVETGILLLRWRKEKHLQGKWEGTQFKADVDYWAHQQISNNLKKLYPSIPVMSEEDSDPFCKIRPNRYWLIDPIDGTASYVQGYDGFVTQIALVEEGLVKSAVIYAPVYNELFLAQAGSGAWCNNKKLAVIPSLGFKNLIDNYPQPRGIAKELMDALNIHNYIESGSISLKICRVADNTADLFIKDVVVRDWDLAAPQLILEEAGGYISYLNGEKLSYDGLIEHHGIVATSSQEKGQKIVRWHYEKDL